MELDESVKKDMVKILKEHKVKKAGIFGSYATGKADIDSDIDILVELDKKSLLELASIKKELEEVTDLEVDINTYNGLNYSTREGLKETVLSEQEQIV